MKTRIIILLGISAIATLSFTFASVTREQKEARIETSAKTNSEPIGGFLSQDKF